MRTFGHRLRHERESRNARIQDVSERTRIGLRYLEALENNDFDALPGPRGFGKLYIRAYAEVLGFDPHPLIEEYEKERRKQLRNGDDKPTRVAPRIRRISYVPPALKPVDPEPPIPEVAEPEVATEPEVAEVEPVAVLTETTEPVAATELEPAKHRGRWVLGLSLIAVALLIVAAVALRPESTSPPSGGGATEPAVIAAQPDTPIEISDPPPVKRPAVTPTASGPISVTVSGVGTSVVDRRLVGEGTRFDEGSEVVFFTRAVGAAAGQTLHHVWLHEGNVIQRIELSLGSPDWRTYSSKTLRKKGNWVVEARGDDNQVLARAEFTCERS